MEYPIKPGMCSVFNGVRKKVYLNLGIHQILTWIKNGKYRHEIINLRRMVTNGDDYVSYKTDLISFTPSALFNSCREGSDIVSFSGILVLDFDYLEDVNTSKKLAILLPYTLACFVSPSGKGIKILVKTNSRYRFSFSYRAAATYYRRKIGHGLDRADDPTRLCFISYDPDLFWNPKSEVIKIKTTKISSDELTRHLQ